MKPHALPLLLLLMAPGFGAEEGKAPVTFKGHTFDVQVVALSPDGKALASGGGDTRGGELKVWDAATGKEVATLPGYRDSLFALAFSPDGKLLASADGRYQVRLWDVATAREVATFKNGPGWSHALALSPDGKRLAAAGDTEVRVWELPGGKEVASFRREVRSMRPAFSRDLKTLASPNYQEIDLWDVAAGKERLVLSEQRGPVRCVDFSADGKVLAAASAVNTGASHYRGEVKLWDVTTGKERATMPGPFGDAFALALSPDGKSLAVLDRKQLDGEVELKVLDVGTGRVRLVRKYAARWPRPGLFLTFMFTPDDRFFVASSPDRRAIELRDMTPLLDGR
jgi:WD40 repeat protein